MAWRLLRFVGLVVLAAGCECGTVITPLDGGADGGMEVAFEPCGPELDEVACVPGGAFDLPEYWWYGEQTERPPLPPSPTVQASLNTFWIDRTEVTNGEYLAAVGTGAVAAPPEDCGVELYFNEDFETGEHTYVRERSGWVDGAIAERLDHPVVCVTRVEAQAYCEHRGGRLPRAPEVMKAARGTEPGARRFPWGDSPPDRGSSVFDQGERDWWLEYASISVDRSPEQLVPSTRPVRAAASGTSPYGVHGLSGNVSEHIYECLADVLDVSPSRWTGRVDLSVAGPWRASCPTRGVARLHTRGQQVLAGSNWGSSAHAAALAFGLVAPNEIEPSSQLAGGARIRGYATIPAMNDRYTVDDPEPNLSFGGYYSASEVVYEPETPPTEAERRSWFVGFRCAYDARPE